jgi:membrane protein implicated in regulation of membrane protease activity
MWEWVQANLWVLWLIAAGGLAVSEMLTLDMTLLMLAGGALAGAGVALSSPALLWLQILVAVVVAVALLGCCGRRCSSGCTRAPATAARSTVLGSTGGTVGEITAAGGEVNVNGETWSARSYDGDPIAAGVEVDVIEVDGLTVVVYPRTSR